MNKALFILLSFGILYSSEKYYGSTLAPVVIAGSIIKSSGVEIVSKYQRKDCPICHGKGWYISGDKITRVDCGYCETDIKNEGLKPLSVDNIEKTRVYRK
jgi:hypothetical protein